MDWYIYIVIIIILVQVVFLWKMRNNYSYALNKYARDHSWSELRAALIIPCKGFDPDFQKNITSFFNQSYENYILLFVVEDTSDPAYEELCRLKSELSQTTKAQDVEILIAGKGQACSQKIHNLLYCYERIPDDIDVLAFADSDACVRNDWLSHIIWPLRRSKYGATSGYRWFVPQKNNLATLALSAINAKIAQLLGNTRFNQAWGGSMAIRVDTFRRVGLDKIWPKALSDDLSLTYAVKKAGLQIAFVPACLVASYESTTWPNLFEFARRQFLITRVSSPGIWWFGLLSTIFSVVALWGTIIMAIYAAKIGEKNLPLFTAVPILFFTSQLIRAIVRQRMISKLLEKDFPKMKAACAADILFFWLWSLLLLSFIISSAFGKTICWRGIRYKLLGPTETIVVSD